jgi:uncharacterized protein with GYD domain
MRAQMSAFDPKRTSSLAPDTVQRHDIITICEPPDDEAATALMLSVASRGNVRTETLRAFSFDEMTKILGKMV